jgi:hypothetical protein
VTSSRTGKPSSLINKEFQCHTASQTPQNGEKIIVIADTESEEQMSITDVLIDASNAVERDEELCIYLI